MKKLSVNPKLKQQLDRFKKKRDVHLKKLFKKLSVEELTAKAEAQLEKFNKTESNWDFFKFHCTFRKLRKNDLTAVIKAVRI